MPLQLEEFLADASAVDLPESELTFDDATRMFRFGGEVGFRRLNQIQKSALWCLWKDSALAGLHGNPELCFAVLELASFLAANGFRAAVADVTSIAVDESLISREPDSRCVQLMYVGRGAHHGMDQVRCGINSDEATHPNAPLLAIGDLQELQQSSDPMVLLETIRHC